MGEVDIPVVIEGSPTLFQGKPVGAFVSRDRITLEQLKEKALKILTSFLTPWQRIDVMKTFSSLHCNF